MEAIILAGGLGTRLRRVVPDLPKSMAPINGQPFLALLLNSLAACGFRTVTLALGYRSEQIRNYFEGSFGGLRLNYSVETEPLGTGGAIRLALPQTTTDEVFVINGDTFLEVDYRAMLAAHQRAAAQLSIAVTWVPDAFRYGALEIADHRVRGFYEKGRAAAGYINAGIYILSRHLLDRDDLPRAFSFETDVLIPDIRQLLPLAFVAHGAFIDIGVPADYARAQTMLPPTQR